MGLEQAQITLLKSRAVPICADGEMVFKEPWEAKAFAIIVTLSHAGHFTWTEWVECFSEHVAKATRIEAEGGIPKSYYEQWVDAAEALLVEKGVTSAEQLFAKRFGAISPTTLHTK